MSRSRLIPPCRRSIATIAGVMFALAAASCSSGSDSATPDVNSAAADATSASAPVVTEVADSSVASVEPATSQADGDSGETVGQIGPLGCDDAGAAAVSAAIGTVTLDTADDVSVDTDQTCLYSNSTSVSAVTLSTESTSSLLGGDLEGVPLDEALTTLGSTQTLFLDDGATSEQITIGDVPAVVVTGTSISAGPVGYAATVVDGTVIEVDVSGTDIAADAEGLGSAAVSVLELVLLNPA